MQPRVEPAKKSLFFKVFIRIRFLNVHFMSETSQRNCDCSKFRKGAVGKTASLWDQNMKKMVTFAFRRRGGYAITLCVLFSDRREAVNCAYVYYDLRSECFAVL